jgi:hypothetical protein
MGECRIQPSEHWLQRCRCRATTFGVMAANYQAFESAFHETALGRTHSSGRRRLALGRIRGCGRRS